MTAWWKTWFALLVAVAIFSALWIAFPFPFLGALGVWALIAVLIVVFGPAIAICRHLFLLEGFPYSSSCFAVALVIGLFAEQIIFWFMRAEKLYTAGRLPLIYALAIAAGYAAWRLTGHPTSCFEQRYFEQRYKEANPAPTDEEELAKAQELSSLLSRLGEGPECEKSDVILRMAELIRKPPPLWALARIAAERGVDEGKITPTIAGWLVGVLVTFCFFTVVGHYFPFVGDLFNGLMHLLDTRANAD